jgi:N-acetylmuramoyl-L-alanine amidase
MYIIAAVVCINLFSVPASAKEHFTVCIDPGHQAKGDPKGEPIAPGSSQKKARVSSGTSGVGTKKAEYKVNLEAAMILKGLLEEKGYTVVMTRESNDVSISNAERAQVANDAKADMTVRLHCDSIENSGKCGAVLIVPSKSSKNTSQIYPASYKYAELLKTALKNQDVKVNGIFERSDMTGFNWSNVPVVIFEMGFMSNWSEDKMLSDKSYQTKLMQAVTEALDAYNQTLS